MRIITGTDIKVWFPDAYVYTAGSCVVYAEDLTQTAGTQITLNIVRGHYGDPQTGLAIVTHTVDSNYRTMFDISEILRTVSEAGGFADIEGSIEVYTAHEIQRMDTDIIAGLCLSAPVWQTPTMLRNVVLFAQQEVMVDFGSVVSATFQRLSGGVWTSGNTYTVTGTEPTASVMQITEGLTGSVQAVRLVDGGGVVMWQAAIEQVNNVCQLRRLALLRWRSDLFAKYKNFWFEVVSIERKQTEKVSLMYQSGEIEHNGQFANERRNWSYYITVQTEAVTDDELRYFEDLFTSPEVTMITGSTGVAELNRSSRVAVDGTSKSITYKPQRARLQFGLLVSKFWSV